MKKKIRFKFTITLNQNKVNLRFYYFVKCFYFVLILFFQHFNVFNNVQLIIGLEMIMHTSTKKIIEQKPSNVDR